MNLRNDTRYLLLSLAKYFRQPPNAGIAGLAEDASILLIRPDHIGDILLSTPAVRALKEAFPSSRLTYLVGPWSRQVLANNPLIDEVLVCNFPGFKRSGGKRSALTPYRQLFREAGRLGGYHFDAVINLRFDFWWGAMLSHFAGIPIRVGYDVRECMPFLSAFVPYVPGKHEVLQNLSLVNHLLPNSHKMNSDRKLEFYPSEEDDLFARNWLLHDQNNTGPVVVLHPGAGAALKLWTAAGFAEVANYLVERFGAQIVVTGVDEERALVETIVGKVHGNVRTLIGASLGQLAAVLRRCRLAVGVDSGPMHLAVAMETPSVHLYGPVSDKTFGPWGDHESHVVIQSGMDCIPCNRLDYDRSELLDHPCVTTIAPADVIAAAEKLLLPDLRLRAAGT